MPKFRVTYCAVKRDEKHRVNPKHGTRELIESVVSFREEKSVEVEARNHEEAIKKATSHLPQGVDLSVSVHQKHHGASA